MINDKKDDKKDRFNRIGGFFFFAAAGEKTDLSPGVGRSNAFLRPLRTATPERTFFLFTFFRHSAAVAAASLCRLPERKRTTEREKDRTPKILFESPNFDHRSKES